MGDVRPVSITISVVAFAERAATHIAPNRRIARFKWFSRLCLVWRLSTVVPRKLIVVGNSNRTSYELLWGGYTFLYTRHSNLALHLRATWTRTWPS